MRFLAVGGAPPGTLARCRPLGSTAHMCSLNCYAWAAAGCDNSCYALRKWGFNKSFEYEINLWLSEDWSNLDGLN
jgi:hypothetical protein